MGDKKKQNKSGFLKILGGIFFLLLLVVGAGAAWAFTLPATPKFERDVVIDADKDDIHEYIGDLRKWDEWGPWRDEDPDIKYTYTDSTTEVGDRMSWTMQGGSGNVEFTEVDPETGVVYRFQWEDYEPTDGAVRYEETEDGKTRVIWSFEADMGMNLPGRIAMHLGRENMHSMFEKGLNKLKKKVEAN